MSNMPVIRRAKKLLGKTLVFRDATVDDASFVLSLRLDELKSKYLSTTSSSLDDQVRWLENYALSTDTAYFIIESLAGESLGSVRLYDAQGQSFCWGSWVVKDGAPMPTAVESALMVYAYGVDVLGFEEAHFDVRKGNSKVSSFHERFGAVRTGETEADYLYRLSGDAIARTRARLAKFLPNPLVVE